MIRALHNKVIVKPCAADQTTEGGLIIPDSVQQRSNKAIIVSVGPGKPDKPMLLKEGETVIHIKGAGQLVDENEQYYLMNDTDVLAVVE